VSVCTNSCRHNIGLFDVLFSSVAGISPGVHCALSIKFPLISQPSSASHSAWHRVVSVPSSFNERFL
jgi:hypothetical protein